ncbi:maleylpyruvate isomerase N-terminal domain-containing protein [Pseudonocardia lacus]|uniref:maleylpyruvate isomerase N-terminal domain-containing protein n=1 Tax=Pseudonocardia lacus TaxID=2835865 RepID=UPI001BDBF3F5|nr:maleylpyruvate isomerase N-terminal domain-containing protein [Pseudonocardia lacus]
MSYELSAERARRALKQHTGGLAESARAAGPDAPVPTASDWSAADVVEHLGQTQHWVAEILERRIADPTQLPTEMAAMPADPQSWPAWLGDSADRAAAAASGAALEAPVFNAAGDERTGGQFWLHSLLNEAVVHGFDAASAAAGSAEAAAGSYDIDADVAAELITNHLAMLTSLTWAARRSDSADALRGTGQTLHWHATDEPTLGTSRDWFIERGPGGASWRHANDAADVTVHGPAGSLLLILTRRLPPTGGHAGDVAIEGDADLVRHWVQHTAHVAD